MPSPHPHLAVGVGSLGHPLYVRTQFHVSPSSWGIEVWGPPEAMQGSGPQRGGPAARSVEVSLCFLVPRPYPKGDERKKACLSALSEVKVQPGERGGAWWEGDVWALGACHPSPEPALPSGHLWAYWLQLFSEGQALSSAAVVLEGSRAPG